jgi:outer membrane protein assembly factor BamB
VSQIAVIAELPAPGKGPAGLAWDGRYLWNADFRSGRLYCLEPDTGAVVDSLLCPGVLSGVAWDGQHLWQTVMDENWLRAVNPRTHDFDRTLVVEGAVRLGDATWDGSQLWVVDQAGALLAVAAGQQAPLRQIAAPAAGGGLAWRDDVLWLAAPISMRYEPGSDSFIWNSAEERFALLALDAASGVELARYPLSFLPLGLAWVGDDLWLSDSTAARLYRARVA